MTPIVCCSCGALMDQDPRPFPKPPGCTDLEPVTSGLCAKCIDRKYGVLVGMVLDGRATLVAPRSAK